jgi:hypothetical protein
MFAIDEMILLEACLISPRLKMIYVILCVSVYATGWSVLAASRSSGNQVLLPTSSTALAIERTRPWSISLFFLACKCFTTWYTLL